MSAASIEGDGGGLEGGGRDKVEDRGGLCGILVACFTGDREWV